MLVVVTPATSTALTTVDSLKAELGLSGDAQDARLGELIDQASSLVAEYCDIPLARFGRQALLETFRLEPGRPRDALILSVGPAFGVTAVTEGDVALVPAVDVELDGEAGMLARLRCDTVVAWCARKVIVAYTAGWILPGDDAYPDATIADRLPKAIERATLETAKALWFGSGATARDPLLRSESTQGVGSTTWQDGGGASGGVPPAAAAMLGDYRQVGI